MNSRKNNHGFNSAKQQALRKLSEAITHDEIDIKMQGLLEILNDHPAYFTTSSCAGRIVVLELPSLGDKQNAVFLGKWHREATLKEVSDSCKKSEEGLLWLLAQPPIIHVGCRDMNTANQLVNVGIQSGFKNSVIKSLGENRIIVEIRSTERLDMPIGKEGMLFCSDTHLQFLVQIANEVIRKSTAKLKRLEESLSSLEEK